MRVKMERSPSQKANLTIFLRGLRAVKHRAARLQAPREDEEDVLMAEAARQDKPYLTKPDWTTWAIKVDGRRIAHLPRDATELTWDADGLVYLGAASGAALLAEVVGR